MLSFCLQNGKILSTIRGVEGAEVVLPDFMGFIKYCATSKITTHKLLNTSKKNAFISKLVLNFFTFFAKDAKNALVPVLLSGLFAIILHYSFTYSALKLTDSSKTAILKQVGILFYIGLSSSQ
mgnify:CR=1 FL=1